MVCNDGAFLDYGRLEIHLKMRWSFSRLVGSPYAVLRDMIFEDFNVISLGAYTQLHILMPSKIGYLQILRCSNLETPKSQPDSLVVLGPPPLLKANRNDNLAETPGTTFALQRRHEAHCFPLQT